MLELGSRCRWLAAELVLGEARYAELRLCVDAAVDAGFMSPHVLDALTGPLPPGMDGHVLDEAEPLLQAFNDLMADQGISWPDRGQAVWLAAEGRLNVIASGEVDALQAVAAAVDLTHAHDDLFPAREYAGDGLDMAWLLALWSCIGDLADMQHPVFDGHEGEAAWVALRGQITDAARAWLQRNGRSPTAASTP